MPVTTTRWKRPTDVPAIPQRVDVETKRMAQKIIDDQEEIAEMQDWAEEERQVAAVRAGSDWLPVPLPGAAMGRFRASPAWPM
jgi:hypothetical protein